MCRTSCSLSFLATTGLMSLSLARGSELQSGGQPPSVADPAYILQDAETSGFNLGLPAQIAPVPDGSAVLFLRSGPRTFVRDLYEFNAATGVERRLLTAEDILRGAAEDLSPEEQARRERQRMTARGIAYFDLSDDGARILTGLSGRLFWIDRATMKVSEISSEKGFPIDPRFSPDGSHVACVRDDELFVYDLATGAELQLTHDAGKHITNGVSEFVAQEEMSRHQGFWWSPDGKTLLVQQTDTSGVERLHIIDAMNPSAPPSEWPYPRPGKENARVKLGFIPVTGGPTRWMQWDTQRFPYLATVVWKPDGPLTLLVQNRTQTEEVLLSVDPASGATRQLLVESDAAWLNLDQDLPRWLPGNRGFLWMTERNGAPQLELRAPDGSFVRAVTSPELGYRKLISVNRDGDEAIVAASADPTQAHLFRVGIADKAGDPEALTHVPGIYNASFSENHAISVQWSSGLQGRSQREVRRRDGSLIGTLHSVAETPAFMPNVELTTVGKDPFFHVAIVRPRNFDVARHYPVIDAVYGGPGVGVVDVNAYGYLFKQWLADHGFIVVCIDGRGTPNRGRDWERAIRGNFIELPLNDHVTALRELAAKVPQMDLTRVGVYGWSFGGYFSAMAVMKHPEVYKAGVAGAPVADWLDYDTHYTERYLGLPQDHPEAYRVSSVLTYASQLASPLLIMHGTTDDNVYFVHSLKISNELLRAGKPHEFLPLSNFTHMVAEPKVKLHLNERIAEFLKRNLITH